MSQSGVFDETISRMTRSGYRVVTQDADSVTFINKDGVTIVAIIDKRGRVATRLAKQPAIAPGSNDVRAIWLPSTVVQCPKCQTLMLAPTRFCPKCGEPRSAEAALLRNEAEAQGISYEEHLQATRGEWPPILTGERRSEILNAHITLHVAQGYRVITQTGATAQLVKPKEFSCFAATLGILFLFIGLLIYLAVYAAQKEPQIYLTVDERGNVTSSTSGV